jgi:hypothetical protein
MDMEARMNKEQLAMVYQGFDLILEAGGSSVRMADVIKQQQALLESVPPEQQGPMLDEIKNKVATLIAQSVKASTETLKAELDTRLQQGIK